jgi:nicotinamide-nucleotide amidase
MKCLRKVELLAIGDELLNGLRENGHLVYLGDQLGSRGLGLTWASELRDEPEEIVDGLRRALGRADLIVVTGGLGPTSDDCTVECTAAALGRAVIHDPSVEQRIRDFFAERGRQPTSNNFKQCAILEGGEPLANPNGTAPGQWIPHDEQLIILLPGPPRELIPMFEHQVLPRLVAGNWAQPPADQLRFRTMGIGESKVADRITPILAPLAGRLRVAYCAHLGYVDVRLSAIDDRLSAGELRKVGEACRERLGEGFLGFGAPDIACLILNQLRGLNKTLAVAESCTGGLLASRFTDIAGASKVFRGGVVCYNNEVKESILGVPGCLLDQHGAVSAECAVAMATAVAELMEADYALAVTGFAGPEGGNEPAGTVFIGYHSPVGVWSRKVVLPGNRTAVKERAVLEALDFLRRKLEKYKVYDLLESLRC